MRVPFIPEARLERAAETLLGEYEAKYSPMDAPPVPIESILEKHLKLTLEIRDLRTWLDDRSVLGATELRRRIVYVDERLDPETDSTQQNRYNFTLAHEIGHWDLHRHLIGDESQLPLIKGERQPDIICRDGDASDPTEIQANRFAAFLLMPKRLILDVWSAFYPERTTISYTELREQPGNESLSDEELLRKTARPLATIFAVSITAMSIRLENLNLIGRNDQLTLC